MARLAFCDYHNMIAILKKYEHNQDFHQIVDFVEASHIRYALTFDPTVYVSYIRQFWSTAMIETTEEGTKILATVDGKLRTVFEFSIRRNLKLNDEAGIILVFREGLSPCFRPCWLLWVKAQALQLSPITHPPLRHNKHHLPHSLPSLPPVTTKPLPTVTPSDTPQLRQYTRRAKIAQSSALPTATDEPASPLGDDSQEEACPTVTGLVAGQDRTGLQRHHTEMASKIEARELEITNLKARVRLLEDRERCGIAQSREDAPIKGRSLDEGELAAAERSTERGSDDTEEMVNVLTSLDAAKILTSRGVQVSISPTAEFATATVSIPIGSCSIPNASFPGTGIPTGCGMVPTASPIFTTATESTPYIRRKGKEKMVESDTPKKKKLQKQIDVQVARELEEEMARDA
nr:xylulose kinase-1 [Tanacetum cinerariifolium]